MASRPISRLDFNTSEPVGRTRDVVTRYFDASWHHRTRNVVATVELGGCSNRSRPIPSKASPRKYHPTGLLDASADHERWQRARRETVWRKAAAVRSVGQRLREQGVKV